MYNQTESSFLEYSLKNDEKTCIYYNSKSPSSPKSLLTYLNYDENTLYKYKLVDRSNKRQVLDDLNNNEALLNQQIFNSLVSVLFNLS